METPPRDEAAQRERFLRGNLLWTAAALCILILGAAALLLHGQYREELRHWHEQQQTRIRIRLTLLDDWLAERAGDAQYLAHSPWIAPAAAGDARSELILSQELTRLRARSNRAAVCMRLPGGRVLSASGGRPELCPAVGKAGEVIASRSGFRLRLSGRSVAETLFGIEVPAGGATVTLWASPHRLFEQIRQQGPMTRTESMVLLYRPPSAREAFVLTPSSRRDNSLPRLRIPLTRTDLAEVRAFSGAEVFGFMRDYADRRVLATAAPVPGLGWGVVVKIDREEALARYWRLAAIQGTTALLLAAAVCALLWSFWQARHRSWMAEQVASEQRFRQLFDNMSSAVAVWDPGTDGEDFTLADVNPAGLRLSPLASRPEALGRPVQAVFPGMDPGVLAAMRLARTRTEAQLLPAAPYRHGVMQAWLDARIYRLPAGPIVTILTDVSERERAAESLRAQWDRLEMVTRNVGVGLTLVSPDYRVLWANEIAHKLFGGIVGRRCHESHDEGAGRDCSAAAVFATGADRVEREQMSLSPDGRPIWTQIISSPLRDAEGGVTAVLQAAVPISERKQLEEALRQAQKMEAVGRLAGGMAHDFNNLMTAVMGYAELLQEDLAGDRKALHNVEEIIRSAERAATLTRQLLAFSRRQVLAPKVVDLNEAVSGIVPLIRRLIGEDVRLRLRPGSPLGLVKVDPGQLEQVLLNLAVNARDAMPRGGTLTIATRDVEIDAALAAAHPDLKPGPAVLLEVADSGHGMDPETLSRAFEPFFTTKPRGKGTGLGLSMVFGIVKQSGGDILVESRPERGTTFSIYLPRTAEPKAAAAPAAARAAPGGRETVLLVEDDGRVRALARGILRDAGYSVVSAADAAEASRLASSLRGPLHLLVSDIVLTRSSGPELARRLSAARPGLKVLYISGYAPDTVSRHIALGSGIAFLAKPFTRAALLRKVRETLDAPAMAEPKA